jgi:MATE family multidrug resistance protein
MLTNNYKKSIRKIFFFALPIMLGNVSQILMGFGDTLVSGHYSTEALAAVGLSNAIINPIFIACLGMMFGITAFLGKKRGEGKNIDHYLPSILWLSVLSSIPAMLGSVFLGLYCDQIGINEELVPLVREYLLWAAPSFLFALIYQALKEYHQSFDRLVFANVSAFIVVGLNIVLNAFFVFNLGLGVKGLALATTLTRVTLAAALIWYTRKELAALAMKLTKVVWSSVKEIARFSSPLAMAILMEVGIFCLVGYLIGRMDVAQSAAHQVVINVASLTFMFPMALGSALGSLVSFEYGARNYKLVKEYIKSGVFMCIFLMGCSACIFATFPEAIMKIFTQDAQVISIGISLLFVAGVFQIFDGAQAGLAGCLRGLGETKIVFIITCIGYWFIALPAGLYLSYLKKMESIGLWWGLAIGLILATIGFSISVKRVLKKIHALY